MAKPTSQPQLSLEAAHVTDDAAGIPEDDWCRLFFEHVYCKLDDDQFADMYQERGRKPLSPSRSICITVLQYMFKVSDRAAVENTIRRRDWRIALGIDSNWEGFHPSVLCTFRQRLIAHEMQRVMFDAVLDRLRELGLLSKHKRLRVDATHIVSDVAILSRADSIREALRVVVHNLYKHYPSLHADPAFVRLHDEYGEEVWVGSVRSANQDLAELGRDGQALLELCGDRPVKGKEVLAQMLEENFVFSENAPPEPLDKDQRPKDHVLTPHEPDARRGKKGDDLWIGDKVHIVETADEEQPNFIVDVMSTDPRLHDSQVVEEVAQRAQTALPEASQLVADGGYASAENTLIAREAGLDLICPPHGSNSKGLLPISEFEIDLAGRVAICPAGHRNCGWSIGKREMRIRFPAAACNDCPRRAECTTSAEGRTLTLGRNYDQLVLNRDRAQTDEFKELYARRAGIEATISHLIRDCGLRRSRYRSGPKRALHAIFAATALNVRRLLHCLASENTPRQEGYSAFLRRSWRLTGAPQKALSAILRGILDSADNPARTAAAAV